MHLGREPRGIVASGVTTSQPFEREHWDSDRASAGQKAWYTLFAPELLLDPERRAPLDPRQAASDLVRDHDWTPQSSGIVIPEHVSEALLREWFDFCSDDAATLGAADIELSAFEGIERVRLVRHRSRERALRAAKIAEVRARDHGRLRCEVPGCGFEFERTYGERGREFAEVHHLSLLATSGVTQTKLSDLRVVCSNCHRMIHRTAVPAELGTLIQP